MPRVRQFGDLRQSRRSNLSNLSACSSINKQPTKLKQPDTLLCIGCVNRSLSNRKQQSRLQGSGLTQNYQSGWDRSFHHARQKTEFAQKQVKAMVAYNKEAQRLKSQEKEQQSRQKQQERNFVQFMSKKQKEQEQKARKRERLLRQKCIDGLKEQISRNGELRSKQKKQKLQKFVQKSLLDERISAVRKEMSLQYRKQLKEQMEKDRSKKKALREESKREIHIKANPILDRAEQRHKLIQEFQQQRKLILIEEARARQEQRRQRQQEAELSKMRQRNELQSRLREDHQRHETRKGWEQENRNRYARQLKQQIQQKKQVRLEKKQQKYYKDQSPFCIQKHKQTMPCDGCHKEVPKVSLTNFRDAL